jgi:hypothetical protein
VRKKERLVVGHTSEDGRQVEVLRETALHTKGDDPNHHVTLGGASGKDEGATGVTTAGAGIEATRAHHTVRDTEF